MSILNFVKSFIIVLMLLPVFAVALPIGIPAYLSLILLAIILQIFAFFKFYLGTMSKTWKRVQGK